MNQRILRLVGLLVLAAIGFLIYFSIIEGFQGITNRDIGNKYELEFAEVCKKRETCGKCLSTITLKDQYGVNRTYDCGWCPESNACIPRVSTYSIIPKWVTDLVIPNVNKEEKCNAKAFVTRAQECPDALCTSMENCRDCATNIRCGWSANFAKCLPRETGSESGSEPGSESGSESGPGPLITSTDSCPAIACSTIKDCAKCTNTTSCGYCKSTSKCVTLDRYGVPPPLTCTQDTIVMGPYQCPGAIDPSHIMSAPLDTRTAPDPTAAQLTDIQNPFYTMDMTQGSMFVTSPVSPPTTYPYVGAGRKQGDSSIPATVRFDPKLGDAPLESYVKMLVTSELAAQGVPTNEPFQVNETQAIGNATDYMNTAFKKIFTAKR